MPEATSNHSRDSGPLYVFDHVLMAVGLVSPGITRDEIIRVEAFWSFDGSDYCAGGFVLCLRDGRRAYLDAWIEVADDGGARPIKVDIEFTELSARQKYPQFPSASDPIGGWQGEVDPLNDFLRSRAT